MDDIDLSALPPETRQRFEEMRREFVDSLTGRLQEVLRDPDLSAKGRALHRLAGAAGSFGFGGLGQLAKCAEMHCEAGRRDDVAEAERQLQECVAQIQAAL